MYQPANVIYARNAAAKGDGITVDGPALREAIASLPANGGIIYFEAGSYLIRTLAGGNHLTIGTGMSAAWSARQGVVGIPGMGSANLGATSSGVILDLAGAGHGIVVQGPLSGWGLENVQLRMTNAGSQHAAVKLQSAQDGCIRCLSIFGSSFGYGIYSSTVPNWAGTGVANTIHNLFESVVIDCSTNTSPNFMLYVTGALTTANTSFDTYVGLALKPGSQTLAGIWLGACDNVVLINPHYYGGGCHGASSLRFAYDNGISTNWPADTKIYNFEGGGTPVTNSGTPGPSATANQIFGFSRTNGGSPRLSTILPFTRSETAHRFGT